MKLSGGPGSIKLKLTLIIIGAVIAFGTLFYTQDLVKHLQEREKEIVQLYANSLEFIANTENLDTNFNFIFDNIIKRIEFPLILTDNNKIINSYKNIYTDPKLTESQKSDYIASILNELEKQHSFISVRGPNGQTLQRIYFGDSDIILRLRYYPYLQIVFAFLFLIIAYSIFSYVKRSEQRNIWVGMSKETAHQLGTPISSLMGWNEMLKMNYNNPDKVLDTSEEIDSDLMRLNKITKRFSKIGSKPELQPLSPFEIISNVINYFQRRLPQSGKTVDLSVVGEKDIKCLLNIELFEWVIENLIKNALDAIEHKKGRITFSIHSNKNNIEIDVEDNGKGIERKNWQDIFRPGYSTKRRGWGLGLSLSKRIVEDYHNGKIFVNKSVINEGTVFRITLRKTEKVT
jgi:anti-sigma regulatory factor (Ser/Thr protein kinase)